MSIDMSGKQNEASKYDKAIKGFGGLRDTLDRAVKILELIRAAEYLNTEDRAFLDEKLDELKARAEEVRIEKLKKPEYTPPASVESLTAKTVDAEVFRNRWNALDSKIENVENMTSVLKPMYSSSPGLNAAIIGALGITPGNTMYGIDYDGKPIEFTVTSRRDGNFYVKDNETKVSYKISRDNVEKYLTPFPEKECLARLKPTLRLYKYEY